MMKKQNDKVYFPTSFGFNRVEDYLIKNPKEKRLLNKLVRLKENGLSYFDLTKYLIRNIYKTKIGGSWTRKSVSSVMKTHIKNKKITSKFV
tara:strand:- start:426 stop:698 length:273 start_codon:yes stop_codon:yes gene_type:complete